MTMIMVMMIIDDKSPATAQTQNNRSVNKSIAAYLCIFTREYNNYNITAKRVRILDNKITLNAYKYLNTLVYVSIWSYP